MKTLKHTLVIRIDKVIVDKLKKLAEEDDRSLANFVNRVFREYLEEKNK